MITTINNNQRIFLVTGDYNQSFICNIQDLEKCCNEIQDKKSIKIQHKWNNRFVRCTKNSIIDMLISLDLNTSFIAGKMPVMSKVITFKGYDYYIGEDKNGKFYNIVPEGQSAPKGGYAKDWILGVKKVKDMF